jgi:hypothetical protein
MERSFYPLRTSFTGQQNFTRNRLFPRTDMRTPKHSVRVILDEEEKKLVTYSFTCLEKSPDRESQRRSSTEDQSEVSSLTGTLRDISPSKRRFNAVPTSADIKRAIQHNAVTHNATVDMKYLLRFPIEVWVSSGEAFVHPPRKCIRPIRLSHLSSLQMSSIAIINE